MQEVWAEYGPPVYIAVAAYLGLNGRMTGADELLEGDDLINFLDQHPSGATRRAQTS